MEKQDTKANKTKQGKVAVIRIRGEVNVDPDMKSTLNMLNLKKKFTCALIDSDSSQIGMIKKVKDHVTYGDIDEETIKLLNEKRKTNEENIFHLHPPRGGFERKGIKMAFNEGGALGNRKDKINELIKRMI